MTTKSQMLDRCKSLLLALASLVVALTLLEAAIQIAVLVPAIDRALFPVMVGWRESDSKSLFAYDERFGKQLLEPTTGFRHVHDAGEYAYTINTVDCLGFHVRPPCDLGGEVSFHFGDSFAFGFGISEADTFVALLNRSGPGQHVNFAIPGDDLLGEIDQARRMLADMRPEDHPRVLYFHAFLGNDIQNGWKYLVRIGELEPNPREEKGPVSRLIRKSRLRGLVTNRLKALRFERAGGKRCRTESPSYPSTSPRSKR